MREGYTKDNPIDATLYKSLYPKNHLPDNSYINYQNKLYFIKNNKLDFIKRFTNAKRPTQEASQNLSQDRHQLKKEWIKKWKSEIKAQKDANNNI